VTSSELFGIARSLALYHGIPFRQGRMRRLYAQFVRPGDLVFDVGAHVGNRTRAFAALGCRVVALEPQPLVASVLRGVCRRLPRVDVVEAAVGDVEGHASLEMSDRHPTLATLADGWRRARGGDPDFAHVRWNRTLTIRQTTLDVLTAQFGIPAFVKIDVEGAEPLVLKGLTRAVPALSFEYLPRALDEARACCARLRALGAYEFNWSAGESYQLESPDWLDAERLIEQLSSARGQHRSGDVYARLLR
jgi:FkbM family methyltransferase